MKAKAAEDRVGDVLLVMGAITPEQLAEAVQRQTAGDPRPLGVLLIELGHACSKDVELALLRQQALRGQLKHADGLRLLEEAHESTRRAASCLAELTVAAEELGAKAK